MDRIQTSAEVIKKIPTPPEGVRDSIGSILEKGLPKKLLGNLEGCNNGNEVRLAIRNFCQANGYSMHPDNVFDDRMTVSTNTLMEIAGSQPMLWSKQLPSGYGAQREGISDFGISMSADGKNIYVFWKDENGSQWYPFKDLARDYEYNPDFRWNGRQWIKLD